MEHILNTKDLGSVSAYGDALVGGYTGTREHFYEALFKGEVGDAVLPVNPKEKPNELSPFISDLAKREEIPVPVYTGGTMTYDGTLQTAQFDNYDPDKMIATGTTGTNVGNYTAVFSLKGNSYKWVDGGAWDQKIEWRIEPAINR